MTKLKEKKFFILEADKKNKNHRTYPFDLINSWVESEKNTSGEGYDLEYALPDLDLEYEFLKEEEVCGNVAKLVLEGKKLFAVIKFKTEGPYSEKIYGDDNFLDTVAIVPKGKGAVKSQIVQDDYELYGFNLILKEESSFLDEELKKEKDTIQA